MADAILFWVARHLADAAAATVLCLLLAIIPLVAGWKVRREQSRCPHDGRVHETQACDAICADCGKNLGFIGTWREKQRHG